MANKAKIIAEPGKQEIFIEREFDASRELLFKACTDPELIPKWWADTKVDKMDAKTGGSWRFLSTYGGGNEVGFHGSYHEVVSPERIIETFEYEGMPEPGHVILQISTLEELPGGRTKFRVHQVFPSVADRDGMLASGMEEGMNVSYGRLDKLLEKLKGGEK